MSTYRYQWGKKAVSGKHDPGHTISNINADLAQAIATYGPSETWRKSLRAGTPWRLVAADGSIRCQGTI